MNVNEQIYLRQREMSHRVNLLQGVRGTAFKLAGKDCVVYVYPIFASMYYWLGNTDNFYLIV